MGWVWQWEGSWGAPKGVLSQRPSPAMRRAPEPLRAMPQAPPGHHGHGDSQSSSLLVRWEILHWNGDPLNGNSRLGSRHISDFNFAISYCRSLQPEIAKACACAQSSSIPEPSFLSSSSQRCCKADPEVEGALLWSSLDTQLTAPWGLRWRQLRPSRHSGVGTKAPTGRSSHENLNSLCSWHLTLNSHCPCLPTPLQGRSAGASFSFPPLKVQMEVWGQPSAVSAADKSRSWPS